VRPFPKGESPKQKALNHNSLPGIFTGGSYFPPAPGEIVPMKLIFLRSVTAVEYIFLEADAKAIHFVTYFRQL
jgi:hypothetical protein